MQFDLEIDKLTHSLEDAQTGEILLTEVLPLEKTDLKILTKKPHPTILAEQKNILEWQVI